MRQVQNIDDLRAIARDFLPKGLFEYIDRGTEDELALGAARSALDALKFHPRVLVDVSKRDLQCTVFGKPLGMPLAVAPTGAAGLLWLDGEIAIARAAQRAGIPFTLSTASVISMERVAEGAPEATKWFQLYMWPDRNLSYQLIDRASRAGYEAMVITLDTPVTPNREYNRRNGFSLPMRFNPRNVFDVACHPRWLLNVFAPYFLRDGFPSLENYPEEMRQSLVATRADKRRLPTNDSLTWDDLRELRARWKGPLLVKGIVHPQDAINAADRGVDGIIVSTHGGRNLDSCVPAITALRDVADAVGHRVDVFMDGGVRRGSDVAKAVALGAKCVFVGRATLWGVAAGGEAGALHTFEILKDELQRTLGFLGVPSVTELGKQHLYAG